MKKSKIYSCSTLRTLSLYTQGLCSRVDKSLVREGEILKVIRNIGCIQIDTLQMVERSQYIVLWSRLGNFDKNKLDELIYNKRKLFEYWLHCASIIPYDYYRFRHNKMQSYKFQERFNDQEWIKGVSNEDYLLEMKRIVSERGCVLARDFKVAKDTKGSWWNWKPAKRALEELYNRGELMIADRVKFNRVYDLKEKVLPVDTKKEKPSQEEENIFWLKISMKALGVCQFKHVADYTYMKKTVATPLIRQLLEEGVFEEILGKGNDGCVYTFLIHRENKKILHEIVSGEIVSSRTTFLSPFDNLFWAKGRDELLWGFKQRLEAYKPAVKREWGYFCLPILHGNELIGRFDSKVYRTEKKIVVKSLYLDNEDKITKAVIDEISKTFCSFMKFNSVEQIFIEKSFPEEKGKMILSKTRAMFSAFSKN